MMRQGDHADNGSGCGDVLTLPPGRKPPGAAIKVIPIARVLALATQTREYMLPARA